MENYKDYLQNACADENFDLTMTEGFREWAEEERSLDKEHRKEEEHGEYA
mgnify:CR=1 FL=1